MRISTKNLPDEEPARSPPVEAPPAPPAPEDLELVDPLTGEVVDRKDRDGLIAAFDRTQQKDRELYAFKRALAFALAALTDGEKKTRRVLGHTRCAKVEMPDESLDQSKLKEAYGRFPRFREMYLRIESIGIVAKEWKKALETSGEEDFEAFKSVVKSAIRPPTATPRITVEK